MKRRKFYKNTLTHCYQRTKDDGVLFYTYSDHLVYFTHYCTVARKHHVKVFAMCQMPDHVHDSVMTDRKENLERFKCETNTSFSRKHNERFHRKGAVFEGPYGQAPKFEEKKAFMHKIAEFLTEKYGPRITCEIKDQYYNMREKVEPVFHIVTLAEDAMKEVGVTPKVQPIRGGTDGANLSFKGLPCPNIFAGGHNFHGKYEYVPLESMVKATEVVVKIIELIAR